MRWKLRFWLASDPGAVRLDAPDSLRQSAEADIAPVKAVDMVDVIDANLGELSTFHDTFGFYVHGDDRGSGMFDRGSHGHRSPATTTPNTATDGVEAHDLAARPSFRDYRAQAVLTAGRVSRATAAGPPGLPAARIRALRVVRSPADRQLVEGPQRPLRLLPLPALVPRRQRHKAEARRRIRRRTRAAAADAGLHAAGQGIGAADLGRRGSEGARRSRSASAKAIQEKLDRLDEAFLFERSIDIETYDRHAEKLREELTLARIDRHSEASSMNST